MQVLDKGFVELVDHMGSDLTVVNAARVSFNKHKAEGAASLDDADRKLIKYLANHKHTSPFRHASLTFRVKAPIFVLRQWMRHTVGSDFNEMSMRYTEVHNEFYEPKEWRKQATVNRQGSEGALEGAAHLDASHDYRVALSHVFSVYGRLLSLGVAREQARMVLPVSIYSEVYWTVSLQALAHFLTLRLEEHAQWEIREYAKAVEQLTLPIFPESIRALRDVSDKA